MLLDLMTTESEGPHPGSELLALHPYDSLKKAVVHPSKVEEILKPIFVGGRWIESESLAMKRERSLSAMSQLRPDIQRSHNPAPYKVSVTPALKAMMTELHEQEAPPSRLE